MIGALRFDAKVITQVQDNICFDVFKDKTKPRGNSLVPITTQSVSASLADLFFWIFLYNEVITQKLRIIVIQTGPQGH